jgi:hypothetical protein
VLRRFSADGFCVDFAQFQGSLLLFPEVTHSARRIRRPLCLSKGGPRFLPFAVKGAASSQRLSGRCSVSLVSVSLRDEGFCLGFNAV